MTPLERLARNQTIIREVNERLHEIANPADVFTDYICECMDVDCTQTLRLEAGEYETVRSTPNVVAVVPGHERLEVERVVDENDRFVVVEKTPVEAVDPAPAVGNREPRPADG